MAKFIGKIKIKESQVLQSDYKRTANILEFYKELFKNILMTTSIVDVVNDIFPEGSRISQFTQNNLFPGKGSIFFHQDPPHNIIESTKLLSIQVCILLTDFYIENGCTLFLDKTNIVGSKGCVYYWPSNIYHSEGVNNTNSTRSCLLLNIQSVKVDNVNFLLGEDDIIPFYNQYINSNIEDDNLLCNYATSTINFSGQL